MKKHGMKHQPRKTPRKEAGRVKVRQETVPQAPEKNWIAAFVPKGPPTVEEILQDCRHDDPRVREAAYLLLRDHKGQDVIRMLWRGTKDLDDRARLAASSVLRAKAEEEAPQRPRNTVRRAMEKALQGADGLALAVS